MIGRVTIPAVAGLRLAAAASLLFLSVAAAAQESKPVPPPPFSQQAPPAPEPGMMESAGRWFKDSYDSVGDKLKKGWEGLGGFSGRAGDAARQASDAAQDAADAAREAMTKFPNSRIIEGRERCGVAANGGPDCRQAAETICKAKGFGGGSSLEIQSNQSCKARAWISGKQEPGDCETRSYVTRAMCQ